MSVRNFQLRLLCRYEDPDNSIADLKVDVLVDGQWEQFDLNIGTAGFLMFVYTIFTCQHMYMRTNCAEKGLMLDSANGTIELLADEDWVVQSLHISFVGKLRAGTPEEEDVAFIKERMKHCPVSINLKQFPDIRTELYFV
jgi:hypothetical protein